MVLLQSISVYNKGPFLPEILNLEDTSMTFPSLVGDQFKSGFGKPGWLDSTEVEYKACTEGVGVVDMTSLGLFEIEVRLL